METITRTRTAYKIGYSAALSIESFSAYHDAARYKYATIRVKDAFFRGYKKSMKDLEEKKRAIAAGSIVFVSDTGEYDDLLSGKVLLADLMVSDDA